MNGLTQQRGLFPRDFIIMPPIGSGLNPIMGGSPVKKGLGHNSQPSGVEKIQVTIPNPSSHVVINSSIQLQNMTELVRNVLARVEDIFHLR